MLPEEIKKIREKIKKSDIGVKDALSVIGMMFANQIPRHEVSSPYEAFEGLNELIDETVHGVKIERFKPDEDKRPFPTFEIQSEEGEILGYLNMISLRGVIPCYYLVYVEVFPSFRGLGLGYQILKAFMAFVKDKKAIGLLDNIIPALEPTYEIYNKLGWKPIADFIGDEGKDSWENYMVFIPESAPSSGWKKELLRILSNLSKKRAVIDIHDNEDMVKRTIQGFRSIDQTLSQLFEEELSSGISNPLMQFMFTQLTTKLLGFRKEIASLIGYTGGESLDQVALSDPVKALPILPYSLWHAEKERVETWGDKKVLERLPEGIKKDPTLFIENLPFYKRPYLKDWMERVKKHPTHPLKISDLLDLGFDPTKLREFHHEGADYIFERVAPHFFFSLLKKITILRKIQKSVSGFRPQGAAVRVIPPLVVLRDRGNVYALRKKVEGIHSQEALDQLRVSPYLKEMNRTLRIDRTMTGMIHEIKGWLKSNLSVGFQKEIEDIVYLFPWDIEKNIPKVHVELSGISMDTIWIA